MAGKRQGTRHGSPGEIIEQPSGNHLEHGLGGSAVNGGQGLITASTNNKCTIQTFILCFYGTSINISLES